jgi:hypothetical protein
MQLIVKNDIFTGKKIFASKYVTVTVTQVRDGKITIKPLGGKESRVYQDIELINNHFTSMDLEKAKSKVSEKPLTKEDKELIQKSTDTLRVFVESEIGDSINDAINETYEDIDNELFNNLNCK